MTCIANTRPNRGEKYVSPDKCRCPKCYEENGDMMYEIGKASAYQDTLGFTTVWSVTMPDRWDLNTVVVGDAETKLKCVNDMVSFTGGKVSVTAKNGTVREIWKAAERAYKKANEKYGDWHYFLECVEVDAKGVVHFWYGS
tara:strand:+ start:620 stop:1042 length:423 start_codon:yes stop_codon:yes gene_type:complete